MPKPIYWSPLSEKDFESILDYLKTNWGDKVAMKFIELTEELINQISNKYLAAGYIHSVGKPLNIEL